MLVKAFVPVFFIDTCVSVPISSEIMTGSTDKLNFSDVWVRGNKLVKRNMDMTEKDPATMVIVKKDLLN